MQKCSGRDINKREQILEAAVRVFAQKGFYKAKVEEIAAEAKIGKGTVYEYFKSKQDLFQGMLKYIIEIYFREFKEDLYKAEKTAKDKIRQLLKSHLKFHIEHRDMSQIFVSEQPKFDEVFKEWMFTKRAEHLKVLQGFIEEGIKTGEIRKLNSNFAAQIILGVINSVSFDVMLRDAELSMENLHAITEDTVDILFGGLAG